MARGDLLGCALWRLWGLARAWRPAVLAGTLALSVKKGVWEGSAGWMGGSPLRFRAGTGWLRAAPICSRCERLSASTGLARLARGALRGCGTFAVGMGGRATAMVLPGR